jgi:Putative phage serine protease XkdF
MTAALFAELIKDVTMSGVHVRTALTTTNGRRLVRHDDKTAKTPFQYLGPMLAQIRPDQVPRVLAALTDSDELPTKELPFDALTAAQNRVDPDKVNAIAASGRFKKPAVVVHVGNGRNLILDGHHRLAAEWLLGRTAAVVRYKDVGRLSNALKGADEEADHIFSARVCKVDEGHGLVFGYAIVCKKDGQDYYDLQDDHIPEDAMLDAAVGFMAGERTAKEMHDGDAIGSIVFAMPLTTDIAKAFGIETRTTGLMIAMKPSDPAVLAKFKDGTYTGFSMGGSRVTDEHVE